MRTYLRARIPDAIYFFTVNLAERQGNDLLTKHIDALREAFRTTKQAHPFVIEAMVVLPDHLHCCGACRRMTMTFQCAGA